jgi:hypothetical protein
VFTKRELSGISQKIANLDNIMANLKVKPILINGINLHNKGDVDDLKSKAFMWYSNATLEGIASCACGATERKVGLKCRHCGTEVTNPIEEVPVSNLWLYVPDRFKGILTTRTFKMLQTLMELKSVKGEGSPENMDVMSWLIYPNYRHPLNKTRCLSFVNTFKADFPNYRRCISDFHDNFDAIFEWMKNYHGVPKDPTKRVNDKRLMSWRAVEQFIKVNRDNLFTRWLPFPSRIIFAVENVSYCTFADPAFEMVMDAIYTASGIESENFKGTDREIETKIAKALISMSAFSDVALKTIVGSKEGLARGHQYGTRMHYNARLVVSSIRGAHRYDEIHLGWGATVNMLQQYIYNRLLRKGLSPTEINFRIRKAIHVYDKEIDEIFDRLIEDGRKLACNYDMATGEYLPGIPMTVHRNPTLVHLANQLFRLTYVFKNPKDAVIAQSPLAMFQPNTDLDGDTLNVRFPIDEYDRMICERFHPRTGVFSTNIPGEVSSAVQMPDEVCACISNFLKDSRLATGQKRG